MQPAANDTIIDTPPSDTVLQARFALAIARERNKAFRSGLFLGVLIGSAPILFRWLRLYLS